MLHVTADFVVGRCRFKSRSHFIAAAGHGVAELAHVEDTAVDAFGGSPCEAYFRAFGSCSKTGDVAGHVEAREYRSLGRFTGAGCVAEHYGDFVRAVGKVKFFARLFAGVYITCGYFLAINSYGIVEFTAEFAS